MERMAAPVVQAQEVLEELLEIVRACRVQLMSEHQEVRKLRKQQETEASGWMV